MGEERIGRKRSAARMGGAALLVAGLVVGCGGEEAPTPSGASMAGSPRTAAEGAGNEAPVIESVTLEPGQPVAHQRLRAVVVASDPDGDALELGYAWRVGGRSVESGGESIEVPALDKGAAIEVTVTASDGRNESASETARVRVGNQRPDLVAVALRPEGDVNRGKPLTAVPAASDPDGDALSFSYRWMVNGTPVDETGDTLDTSELKRGDTVRLRVVANDGDADSNAIESPELRVANASPAIKSSPPAFEGDGSYRYAIEAVDPDGDRTLRYRLAHAPDGMTIDAVGGLIEWKPSAASAGKHTVEVVVDDLQGGSANQIFELSVAVQEPPKDDAKTAPPASASDEDEDQGDEVARVSAKTRGPTPSDRSAKLAEGDEAPADGEE